MSEHFFCPKLFALNIDIVIASDGYTKYIQAPDVCWNKPFEAMITEFFDQWLSEGVHQFTEGIIMKFPLQEKNH